MTTATSHYLTFLGIVLAVGLVVALTTLPLALAQTRRDRRSRHESIPTYYGRLHFAH